MSLLQQVIDIIPGFHTESLTELDLRSIIEYNRSPYKLSKKMMKSKMDDLESAFTYIYISNFMKTSASKYSSIYKFLKAYPDFKSLMLDEILSLFKFANFVNVIITMKIKCIKHVKIFTLAIGAKICDGWDVKYVTGSGQTNKTSRRTDIFENETGVHPNKLKYIPRDCLDISIVDIDEPYKHDHVIDVDHFNFFEGEEDPIFDGVIDYLDSNYHHLDVMET